MIVVEHFHGAASRVPVADTACTTRVTGFNVVIISQWPSPRENDRHIAWCRDTYTALKPYLASTRYMNYLGSDEEARSGRGRLRDELRPAARSEDANTIPRTSSTANVNIRPR